MDVGDGKERPWRQFHNLHPDRDFRQNVGIDGSQGASELAFSEALTSFSRNIRNATAFVGLSLQNVISTTVSAV